MNNARRCRLKLHNEHQVTPDVLSPAGMIRSKAMQRDTGRIYASLERAHNRERLWNRYHTYDLEERYHS